MHLNAQIIMSDYTFDPGQGTFTIKLNTLIN